MSETFNPAVAALLGAVIGGILSVLASWLAQRVQAKALRLSQEIDRRQRLYGDFIDAAVRCYGDALHQEEPNAARLARLYGDMGRMRLHSSRTVVREANRIAHKILEAFGDSNRSYAEIRELLAQDAVDLFSNFGEACRAELLQLDRHWAAEADSFTLRFLRTQDSSLARAMEGLPCR